MAKYAKWLAGGLGFALGGPIGALLGFVLGSAVENVVIETSGKKELASGPADFEVSLIILVAAVMKADGKVLKSELDYVRSFFAHQFGDARVKDRMIFLRDVMDHQIHVKEVCDQIRNSMDHPARLQLMHFLFGISYADGDVHSNELLILQQISHGLGINPKDFASLKAMFYKDSESAYIILEIEKSVSDDEVKKAYRRMAIKYHPDKVEHLGSEFRKAAHEKFQKVNEAYELIRKERKMK
jgi:DnaJ like chaperone protein